MLNKNTTNCILFPLFLLCYETVINLSNDMYLPALLNIKHNLGISLSMAQFTLTLWFIGSASMQLILGPISNRFGRRPVLLIGGVIFIYANLLRAIAQSAVLYI